MPKSAITSLTLFGKAPWGISLAGGRDQNLPIVVTKVRQGSAAARSNLQPGDVIVAVNGDRMTEVSAKTCEAMIDKARASLFLLLVKGGARVNIGVSGKATIDGDRSVYDDETSDLQRMSQYNRSAQPFSASISSFTPTSPAQPVRDWSKPKKPEGFRSVTFNPKGSLLPASGKENKFNNKPRGFLSK